MYEPHPHGHLKRLLKRHLLDAGPGVVALVEVSRCDAGSELELATMIRQGLEDMLEELKGEAEEASAFLGDMEKLMEDRAQKWSGAG